MSKGRVVTVGLIQMAPTPDADANLARAVHLVEQAADGGARIVCLPELFRSQYFCQSEEARMFDLAESVPGPSTEALGAVAAGKKITVIVPVFERRTAGVYHNSAAIIDPQGGMQGLYRKMHIPDDPGILREVLLHAGRPGLPGLRHTGGPHRYAHLLGPVVS